MSVLHGEVGLLGGPQHILALAEALVRRGVSVRLASEWVPRHFASSLVTGCGSVAAVVDAASVVVITPGAATRRDATPLPPGLEAHLRELGGALSAGVTVIVEEELGVGALEGDVVRILEEASSLVAGDSLHVGYAPDRTPFGRGWLELLATPRWVTAAHPQSVERVADLYRSFLDGAVLTVTSCRAVEWARLAELATQAIAQASSLELGECAERLGVDGRRCRQLTHSHAGLPVLPGSLHEVVRGQDRALALVADMGAPLASAAQRVLEQRARSLADHFLTSLGAGSRPTLYAHGALRPGAALDAFWSRLGESGVDWVDRDARFRAVVVLTADEELDRLLDGREPTVVVDTEGLLDAGRWRRAGHTVVAG